MQRWQELSESDRHALYTLEEELEMRALDTGIARYREQRYRNAKSNGGPEQELIGKCLDRLIPAIENLQQHVASGKAAKGATYWAYPLLSLRADKLAFLTLAEIVNHADTGPQSSVASIASAIGSRAKIEREFELLRKTQRDVYEFLLKRNKRWTRRAHRTAKAKASMIDCEWSASVRAWLGTTLLGLAVENTDILIVERFFSQGKSKVQIRLATPIRQAIEKAHSECELLRPSFLPMVTPPGEWSNLHDGGYIWHRLPLIKPNKYGPVQGDAPDPAQMATVCEAINRLQQTEWAVNTKVLDILTSVWEAGGGWAGLPPSTPLPVPPPAFNWDSASKEQKTEWKVQASRIHDSNAQMISQRKAILHSMWVANRLRNVAALYMPFQLDWRSRAYPIPAHLQPQADDISRSLLTFATGKPLGNRGMYWLKVHLANCYGMDKLPLDRRVEWVDSCMTDIRLSAESPTDHRWWAQGDSPWQTLAACFELSQATPDSLSCLPIHQDGSCNGLQHFSAMGRDEVGGKAVNLLPSEIPSDVYQQIADRVTVLIESDRCALSPAPPTDSGSSGTPPNFSADRDGSSCSRLTPQQLAAVWKDRITRKIVKRATMTIVYGLTKQGMKTQFIEDGHCDFLESHHVQHASYLRDKTWQALEGVLSGAGAIMDWLRECASLAAKAGKAVQWTTPIGMRVNQFYAEPESRHIYTAMQKLTIREVPTDSAISLSRQVRGIAPNFVHSFDAAHMMLTILDAGDEGITHFSMIHDSYGTHAADVDVLHECLRRQFLEMYKYPILPDIHADWERQLEMTLPPPPVQGTLDLSQVIQSLYFFA